MLLDGEPAGAAARRHAYLRVDRSQVSIHGPDAHGQGFSRLPIGEAGGDQPEDLNLPRCQSVDCLWADIVRPAIFGISAYAVSAKPR